MGRENINAKEIGRQAFSMDLNELQAAHDAAADAITQFETDYTISAAEWKARRKAVNDAYREADAALQVVLAQAARLSAARNTLEAAGAQVIMPNGLGTESPAPEIGVG